MRNQMTIYLFGPQAVRKHVGLILENQPDIKRIDASPDFKVVRILGKRPLTEEEILLLLSDSGIGGFTFSN